MPKEIRNCKLCGIKIYEPLVYCEECSNMKLAQIFGDLERKIKGEAFANV